MRMTRIPRFRKRKESNAAKSRVRRRVDAASVDNNVIDDLFTVPFIITVVPSILSLKNFSFDHWVGFVSTLMCIILFRLSIIHCVGYIIHT